MTILQIIVANIACLICILLVYSHTGWRNIKDCYNMWFTSKYWTPYNIVEFLSWAAKAIIIIPGLVFGIQIW